MPASLPSSGRDITDMMPNFKELRIQLGRKEPTQPWLCRDVRMPYRKAMAQSNTAPDAAGLHTGCDFHPLLILIQGPLGVFWVDQRTSYALFLGAVSRWEDSLHTTKENDTRLYTPNAYTHIK